MPTTVANIVLVVACALVDSDGRVLVVQQPDGKSPDGKSMAGLWVFPGGKVKAGETPESALIRALKEALSIDVTAACLAPLSFASHGLGSRNSQQYDSFHLLMPLYVCRKWDCELRPRTVQMVRWCRPRVLFDLAMSAADMSLVAHLRDAL